MANPWFISSARDALEMGHRCVAARLNAILFELAPGMSIDADPPRLGDSMAEAMRQFRRALPGLRTVQDLPASDFDVCPWTLGFVNDDNNLPYDIRVTADWSDIDPFIFDFLRIQRTNWTSEHWQRLIVEPVEQQRDRLRGDLDQLAAASRRPEQAVDEAIPLATMPLEPKQYVQGWSAIAAALKQRPTDTFRKAIKKWHERSPSPIQFPGPGRPPLVERAKLIKWWNSLDQLVEEKAVETQNKAATAANSYPFGRDGTVVPDLQGHQRKRRSKSGAVRKTPE